MPRTRSVAQQLSDLRRDQERQDRRARFWQLWDLRWGVRKELIFLGLGVALPIFAIGIFEPFASSQYILAVPAAFFGGWSVIGLLPTYGVREVFVTKPEAIDEFMANHRRGFKDGQDFSKKVYSFLRARFRGKKDRRGLSTLIALENCFEWYARNAAWVIPVGTLFVVTFAVILLLLVRAVS